MYIAVFHNEIHRKKKRKDERKDQLSNAEPCHAQIRPIVADYPTDAQRAARSSSGKRGLTQRRSPKCSVQIKIQKTSSLDLNYY